MSKVTILHLRNLDAQSRIIGELSRESAFRHYDITDPVSKMLENASLNHETPTAVATLAQHLKSSCLTYDLAADAPLASLLWREIGDVVRRDRIVVITGFTTGGEIEWLAAQCIQAGATVKAAKVVIKPVVTEGDPFAALDWQSTGISESFFDRTFLYETFGDTELAELLKELNNLGT